MPNQGISSPRHAINVIRSLTSRLDQLANEFEIEEEEADVDLLSLFEWLADVIDNLQAVKDWMETELHKE